MAKKVRPPSRATLEKLEEALRQPGVVDKVLGVTRRLVWTLANFGLPGGDDVVKEYVHRAIDDTILGIRTWRPETSLSTHLCGVTRNHVRNDFNRVRRKPHVDYSDLPEGGEVADDRDEGAEAEGRQFTRAVFEELYRMARENEDEGVEAILVALESDVNYEGRTDLAEACDMTVNEVTATKKRLARLIENLPSELQDLS